MSDRHIYLDHSASTPVDEAVVEAMLPFWTKMYGNPSSAHHHGRLAQQHLEEARRAIAADLGARPSEIIFTGCGSESDNLALRGVMWAARSAGRGNHLITSAIEHKAVLDTAHQLRDHFGFDVTVLPVDRYGRISLDDLAAAIRPDTALISLMAANNEIGTVQPYLAAAALARERGVLFHSDAVQAAGMVDWDMASMPIDLMSLAPHKFYGPKGIGILYAREGVNLLPSLTGGSQEDGRRAGTVNVAFAVGAARALSLARAQRAATIAHETALRDRLIEGLLAAMPDDCVLTGHPTERLPHHASFAFRHLNGNNILIQLDMVGISASSGSACTTGNPKPSATLEALGLAPEWCLGGLRLTLGRQTTAADIDYAMAQIPPAIERLRAFASLFAN